MEPVLPIQTRWIKDGELLFTPTPTPYIRGTDVVRLMRYLENRTEESLGNWLDFQQTGDAGLDIRTLTYQAQQLLREIRVVKTLLTPKNPPDPGNYELTIAYEHCHK